MGLFGAADSSPKECLAAIPSRIAPAVFGLRPFPSSKVVFKDGLVILDGGGLAAPELMTDERLPDTEWPRRVDMELSVSDEMVDKGRMYSMRSENPTRAREKGRRVGDESESLRNSPDSSAE